MPRIDSSSSPPSNEKVTRWTVSDLARRAQCTLRTIRFYEQRGLLGADRRTGGRHRRYSQAELDRLSAIIGLRRVGLSLEQIRSVFETRRRCETGAAAAAALGSVIDELILEVDARALELERLRHELEVLRTSVAACKDCSADPRVPRVCSDCERPLAAAGENPLTRTLWSQVR